MKSRFLFAVISLLLVAAGVRAEGTKTAHVVYYEEDTDNGVLIFFSDDNENLTAGTSILITVGEITTSIPLVDGKFWSGEEVTNVVPDFEKDTHPEWYKFSPKITKVVFDASFASAKPTSCYRWFKSCEKLTTIDGWENLNTENVTNLSSMFALCSSLTSVDLSKFSTYNVLYMDNMFNGCSSLTELNVSTFNTSKVVEMYEMFAGCKKLTELDLRNFDTQKVKTMGGMFKGCSELASLDISSFRTPELTETGSMFDSCEKLTNIDLTNFDMSKVTLMSSMFHGCKTLETIKFNTDVKPNVTGMASVFYDCHALKEIDLSSFNTSNVTIMENLFRGCEALKTLNLGDNFYTGNVKGMNFMFGGCKLLESLVFDEKFDTSNVTNMRYMFSGCYALHTLDVSKFNTSNVTNMEGMFSACTALSELDLINFDTHKVTLMNNMFYNYGPYSNLKKIKLGENFTTEKATNLSEMFSFCNALEKIEYTPGGEFKFTTAEGTNLTNLRRMFHGCKKLTSVDLSGLNTENVTNMREMFTDCQKLDNDDFNSLIFKSASGVELKDICDMFHNCTGLTSIDLSGLNTKGVVNTVYTENYNDYTPSFNNLFSGCTNLLEVDMKNAVISSEATLTDMFKGCNMLRFVDLSGASVESAKLSSALGTYRPLMYVKEFTGALMENVVVGEGTGRTCGHFVIDYDDTAADQLLLKAKYPFMASKITINRNFETDKLYTLYMPFAMSATAHGTFYTYDSYDTENSKVNFMAVKEPETTTLPNTPYLFKPAGALNAGIVIEAETEVSDNNSQLDAAEPVESGLVGVYRKKLFTEEEQNQMVYYCWANGDKNFYRVGNGARVDASRAYLKFVAPDGSGAPARLSASFDDGGTTGISSAADGDGENTGAAAPAYNLQGQRVGTGYKGIVIRNGKKIIVK